jgi:hypothetical protein
MRITFVALLVLAAACTRSNGLAEPSSDGGDGNDDGAMSDGDGGQSSDTDLALSCGDLLGKYAMIETQGNCNDLNKNAPQCVNGGTNMSCVAHFVSVGPSQQPGAVNGTTQVSTDASFTNAGLFLGTVKRNCRGTFDAATQKLTITCGAAAEECTIVMTRIAESC